MRRTLLNYLMLLLAMAGIALAQKQGKHPGCVWYAGGRPPIIIGDAKEPALIHIMNTSGFKFDFTAADSEGGAVSVETALIPEGQEAHSLKGHPCYHAPAPSGSVSCTFAAHNYQWIWRRTDGKPGSFMVTLKDYQHEICWKQ